MNDKIIGFMLLLLGSLSCSAPDKPSAPTADSFPHILNINYTPGGEEHSHSWFTDAGSWYGFTLPEAGNWINGFCGPYHLAQDQRMWLSTAIVQVCFQEEEASSTHYHPDTTIYYPGKAYLKASSQLGTIEQELVFVNASTVLLTVWSNRPSLFRFFGEIRPSDFACSTDKNTLLITRHSGEGVAVSFPPEAGILTNGNEYETLSAQKGREEVVISFFSDAASQRNAIQKATSVLSDQELYRQRTAQRWDHYLSDVLRTGCCNYDDRKAVEAAVVVVSNWKTARGDFHQDGLISDHTSDCFEYLYPSSTSYAVGDTAFVSEIVLDYAMQLSPDTINFASDNGRACTQSALRLLKEYWKYEP